MINIIKKARYEKNLKQVELAKIIGYSRQAVSQLEKGEFKPTYKTLIILSNVLEIDIKTLVYYFAFLEK